MCRPGRLETAANDRGRDGARTGQVSGHGITRADPHRECRGEWSWRAHMTHPWLRAGSGTHPDVASVKGLHGATSRMGEDPFWIGLARSSLERKVASATGCLKQQPATPRTSAPGSGSPLLPDPVHQCGSGGFHLGRAPIWGFGALKGKTGLAGLNWAEGPEGGAAALVRALAGPGPSG